MDRPASTRDTDLRSENLGQPSSANLPPNLASSPQSTDPSADSKLGPGDAAKRPKHTRVHKREKELCGLVTPIFLPLLDAGTSPTKKKEKKRRPAEEKGAGVVNSPPNSEHDSPSRDAEKGKENRRSRSKNREDPMELGESSVTGGGSKEIQGAAKENQKPEAVKKSKRAAVKKSSLRHTNTPRPRRKRVSLVIDDQIVLPADSIAKPPLASPSETIASTNSTSASTASLEDSIDPRLISPYSTSGHHEHQDPVHHSLALPASLPSTSPTKHTGHVISESPPVLEYEPPQTATRTFLDTSPPKQEAIVPQYASRTPIYANQPDIAEGEEEDFSTYVGGISGSGVDDVDQAGSYGYPSSLGASYLESYMKSRPLSVRVAAAEKAELEADEKRALINGEADSKEDIDLDVGKVDDADETMDIIGNMEEDDDDFIF
ncbi:hypothetical protein K505DRAFT_326540 [Melanomma pulvis-pyrius CBS 109.77]|uniref:Uncharacterized protein n=1 Tax=Melanomma pulvis-pyrius CBS 109.77 TaxID=1314802 RepID=A0A6A6X5Y0_9PLEO|nr:hypothetical protein K505DRAFT_326540 [Melanomma pulvis-pyrius CBS 109.77]